MNNIHMHKMLYYHSALVWIGMWNDATINILWKMSLQVPDLTSYGHMSNSIIAASAFEASEDPMCCFPIVKCDGVKVMLMD